MDKKPLITCDEHFNDNRDQQTKLNLTELQKQQQNFSVNLMIQSNLADYNFQQNINIQLINDSDKKLNYEEKINKKSLDQQYNSTNILLEKFQENSIKFNYDEQLHASEYHFGRRNALTVADYSEEIRNKMIKDFLGQNHNYNIYHENSNNSNKELFKENIVWIDNEFRFKVNKFKLNENKIHNKNENKNLPSKYSNINWNSKYRFQIIHYSNENVEFNLKHLKKIQGKTINRIMVLGYPLTGKTSLIEEFDSLLAKYPHQTAFNPLNTDELELNTNCLLHFNEVHFTGKNSLQKPIIEYDPDIYLLIYNINNRFITN